MSASAHWRLFFAFVTLSIIVTAIGLVAYALVADSIRQREYQQLSAIAEFKKDQIINWLAERRDDIQVYLDTPFFAEALSNVMAGTALNNDEQLAFRLDVTRKAHGYVGTEILTLDGQVVADSGNTGGHGAEFQAAARRALEQSGPVLLDLHRPDPAGPVRLAYVAAVRDVHRHERPAVGWVVFTVDPERAFYPMLGAWPTTSTSGETFIVRRDGDDVLFLSNLRHRNDKPLSLRFPLSRREVPAVQAVTRGNGTYEGVDYRGKPVLTATRQIAGTPWMLLSKIDQVEVFAEIRIAGEICSALILSGIIIVGLVLVMAWRNLRLRNQVQLDQHLRKIASMIPGALVSCCLLRDGSFHIPYISDGARDLIGLGADRLQADGTRFFDLMAAGERGLFERSLTEAARSQQTWCFEWRIHHPVKGERWIAAEALPQSQADATIVWHGHLQDITERKTIETILREKLDLQDQFTKVVASVPGLVCSFRWRRDGQTSMPYASPAIADLFGLLPEEVADDAEPIFARIAPEDTERVSASMVGSVQVMTAWRGRFRFQHPAKGERWIEGHGVPKREADNSILWHGYLHDVTESKQTEITLGLTNRVLRARNQSNLALLHAVDEISYLRDACGIIVDVCDHTMMWIGYADHGPERRVLPVAMAGLDHGYLEGADITWRNDKSGQGPVGTAIRTHRPIVCQNISDDPMFAPWRGEALQRGYYSCVALPLVAGSDVLGALAIYSSVPDAFPEDEIQVLSDIAGDIAHGIFVLRLRIAHALAERSLRESDAKLRLFIEHAPAALAMFDVDMRYEFASRRWVTDFGLEGQDIIGKLCDEVSPNLSEHWKESLRHCLRGSVEKHEEDMLLHADGRSTWLRWESRPWYMDKGTVGGIVIMSEDITANKRTQEVLDRYRLHLEKLVDERTRQLQESVRLAEERAAEITDLYNSAPCGYHSLDLDGIFVSINDTELSWLGYHRDEIVGKMRFVDLLAPDERPRFEANFARFLAQGYLFDQEYELRGKGGGYTPVLLSKTMVRDESGAFLMSRSVTFNLTERKQTEIELQRYRDGLESLVAERTAALSESNRQLVTAKEKAEAANLAKSTFLTNMSHELRTPLTAVLGFTQLLEQRQEAENSEEYTLCIDHILKNGKLLLSLINDLLDLAKIDAGHVATSLERIRLAELLSGYEVTLLPLAEACSIIVSVGIDDGLPDVRADHTRLSQVLLNLGSNAIKFNRPGGRVDVSCERSGPGYLRLTVADTGAGISRARQKEVFEPFNRLGREAGTIEGTGIGLALSRRLMHLMGGDIGFSSNPGEGSQFWIDLPVYVPTDDGGDIEESTVPTSAERAGDGSVGNRTVLCVDDNAAARDLVARIIAGIPGTRVLAAVNAEEGLELAKRHCPDLILMDINLPGMDGIAALAELRQHKGTRAIPVYALSAAATETDIEKGLIAGFDRYLTKPYDIRELLAVLKDQLADRKEVINNQTTACDKEAAA